MVEFQDALVIAGVTLVVVIVLHLATFWVAKIIKPTPPPAPIIQYLPAPQQLPAPSAVALPPQLPQLPQLPPPTRIEQSAQAQQVQQGQPQLPAPIETRSLTFPENGMGGGGFGGAAGGGAGIYKETQTTIQLPSYATPSSAVPPQSAIDPSR
jgi:hypothetical protein